MTSVIELKKTHPTGYKATENGVRKDHQLFVMGEGTHEERARKILLAWLSDLGEMLSRMGERKRRKNGKSQTKSSALSGILDEASSLLRAANEMARELCDVVTWIQHKTLDYHRAVCTALNKYVPLTEGSSAWTIAEARLLLARVDGIRTRSRGTGKILLVTTLRNQETVKLALAFLCDELPKLDLPEPPPIDRVLTNRLKSRLGTDGELTKKGLLDWMEKRLREEMVNEMVRTIEEKSSDSGEQHP